MKPHMQETDVNALDEYFDKYCPKSVLEWGSGGSTVYFPSNHDCIKQWISIEHDAEWHGRVVAEVDPGKVTCLLRPRYYYQRLKTKINSADFILIDGIYRKECLEQCAENINSHALVFLHDSGRRQYHQFFDCFKKYRKITTGRVSDPRGGFKRDGLHVFWK